MVWSEVSFGLFEFVEGVNAGSDVVTVTAASLFGASAVGALVDCPAVFAFPPPFFDGDSTQSGGGICTPELQDEFNDGMAQSSFMAGLAGPFLLTSRCTSSSMSPSLSRHRGAPTCKERMRRGIGFAFRPWRDIGGAPGRAAVFTETSPQCLAVRSPAAKGAACTPGLLGLFLLRGETVALAWLLPASALPRGWVTLSAPCAKRDRGL